MKKFLLIIISLFILVGLALSISAYSWYTQSLTPVSSESTKNSFVVSENESATSVLTRLESAGLIRSSLAARIYLRLTNASTSLLPGAYVLTPNKSFAQVFQVMTSPPQDVWVTFPEGWRHEQFGYRLESVLAGPNSRFKISEFLAQAAPLEGQLFPDTYLINVDSTAADIIRILTANFTKKTGLNPVSDRDTIIIASLIERESRNDSERPVIAGIIKNRLDQGWLLNIDATIQYAVDTTTKPAKYWQPITDTKYPSVYNTYLNLGLPPGPISSPSLSSIRAAQTPAKTDFMFYLHDPEGVIHYARTLPEHNSNVDKYLRS